MNKKKNIGISLKSDGVNGDELKYMNNNSNSAHSYTHSLIEKKEKIYFKCMYILLYNMMIIKIV